MVALYVWFILIVNFQIVLMAPRGITLPLNTVTTKIESFKILAPNVPPSELEPTSMIQAYSSCKPESYFESLQVPHIEVMAPKIDNSFNLAQSLREECALKYGHYNKISLPPKINSAPNLSTKESTEYLADFLLPPSTSMLNLPLKVSSSVTPLDPLSVTSIVTKFDPSVSSSFDKSNILQVTDSNSEFTTLPLTFSSILSSGTSRSALDLAKSVESSKSKFMSPTSSSSTISTLPNFESTGTMSLTSLCSSLTFPLSVSSKTIDTKPSQSAGEFSFIPKSPPSSDFSNSIPSYFLPSQTYYGDQIFVPTPNTLPKPLIPSSISYSQVFGSFLPTSSSVGSEHPILTSSLDSSLNQYSNPTISSTQHRTTHVFANKCPEIPASTLTLQTNHEIYTEFIKNFMNFTSFETKLTSSSLYRNCHSLKPFPPYSFPSSTNTSSIPSPSLNKAPQGLDIMPISYLTESNSYLTLPLLKSEAVPSILENTLIASQRTLLPEFELLSLNSLSSPSSLPLSSSNLSPSQNLPAPSLTSNSFSISNDNPCPLFNIEEPDRTFKRSPSDNVESINIIPAQFVNPVETNEALIDKPNADIAVRNSKKLSPSSDSVRKLLQLMYLAEMLNNDENCNYRVFNEIMSSLTV